MGDNGHLDRDGLPPRPDPRTGLPRPPRAPGGRGTAKESWDRDDALADAPPPPPGEGPVLAWYRVSVRFTAVRVGLGITLVVLVLWAREGFGLNLFRTWWLWLILVVGVAMVTMIGLVDRIAYRYAAGAEWVANHRDWVRTYELADVRVKRSYLLLRDRAGRRAGFELVHLRTDALLWDLVYNGILHSVVDGRAEIDDNARNRLRLVSPDENEIPH